MKTSVFPPNPHEVVEPASGVDALGSTLVGMTEDMPREVIIGHLRELDANSVVYTAMNRLGSGLKGQEPDRKLNPVERKFTDALEYCVRMSLISSSVEAAAGD